MKEMLNSIINNEIEKETESIGLKSSPQNHIEI